MAWDDVANSMLERTLDDSANRRVILPEAFLCADEMVSTARRLVEGLQVSELAVKRNLAAYGVFAATERLLMAAVAAGASRQEMHEVIRVHSLARHGRKWPAGAQILWWTAWQKMSESAALCPP